MLKKFTIFLALAFCVNAQAQIVAQPLKLDLNIQQISADKDRLIAISNNGELWQIDQPRLLATNASPQITPVTGFGKIAFANKNHFLTLLDGSQTYISNIKLAPHSQMLLLRFAIIVIIEEKGKNYLVRVEQANNNRLEIVAKADLNPLSDMKLLQANLEGSNNDFGHIVVLAKPTSRYAHAVLGDNLEASELHYLERHSLQPLAKPLKLTNLVFEANELALVQKNGKNQIVTVLSGDGTGARTAIIELKQSQLKLVANSEPLPTYRWQSPFVFNNKIYAIQMPHLTGHLVQYQQDKNHLNKIYLASGLSNHKIGSRQTNLVASNKRFAVIPYANYLNLSVLDTENNLQTIVNKLPSIIIKSIAFNNHIYLLLKNGKIWQVFDK